MKLILLLLFPELKQRSQVKLCTYLGEAASKRLSVNQFLLLEL